MNLRTVMKQAAAVIAVSAIGSAAHAASITAGGYNQNFDGIGTSTALSDGWSAYQGASGTTHSTWTASTGIPGSGVAAMVANTSSIVVNNAPTGSQIRGYNAANPYTNTSDRVLASAPTGVAGFAWQVALTNNTGTNLTGFDLSYDVIRYTTVNNANGSGSPQEELPGYELFYSTNGTSWTNASSFNVTNAANPSYITSTGVDTFTGELSFANAVANGGTFYLRWVDDNGVLSSPDQILGLNNVSMTSPVPLPAGLPLLASALGGFGLFGRRSRKQHAG